MYFQNLKMAYKKTYKK